MAALTQVILGVEITPENNARVRQWVSEAPTKVSIASASLSPIKFKVEIADAWRRDA